MRCQRRGMTRNRFAAEVAKYEQQLRDEANGISA